MRPLLAPLLCILVVGCADAATTGWSGDGGGRYPGARPPTAFSLAVKRHEDKDTGRTSVTVTASEGIAWTWDDPSFGHAQPVVAGDLVLVQDEPYLLVALGLADGKERWRADNTQEAFLDEAGRQRLAELREQCRQAAAAREGFPARVAAFEAQVKAAEPGYLETPNWKVTFAGDRAPKGFEPAAPQDAGLATTWRELTEAMATWKLASGRKGWSQDIEALPCRIELADSYNEWGSRNRKWETLVGAGFAAPLVEGERVYVAYSNNVVACHDLAGGKVWSTWDRAGRTDRGGSIIRMLEFCASPVVAGDLLVVAQDHDRIRAYGKATGEKRWEASCPKRSGWAAGSPAVMTLGSEQVIIAANGLVYRAADGTVLSEALPATSGTTTPLVDGDVVYVRGSVAKKPVLGAWRLALSGDTLSVEELWRTDRTGQEHRGPVLHDGLLYLVQEKDGKRKREPGLVVLKAGDGSLVAEVPFGKDKLGGYPKLAVTDSALVLDGLGGIFTFYSLGGNPERIARARIAVDAGYGASTFHQGTIIVRGKHQVICIKDTQ